MSLKEIYQRFRAWQIEPYQYKCESVNRHKCFNCGNSFEGDYCYVCGQKYKKGPVGWTPDEKHPKPLWGLLEPGTIVSYFLQLLGRPGYMIGDHLDGRKQMTGSPFKLMCYCAIAALFVLSITGNNSNRWIQSMDGDHSFMGICLKWMSSNLDWAVLIQTVLLIIPVWLLFRYAPKHTRHTIVQGFFIQAYMASLVLICILLRAISDWLILLVPICNYVVYRQLFGYGVWGTLWRTVLSIGIIFYIFAVLMATIKYLQGELPIDHSTATVVFMAITLIVAGIAVLLLGYWIGKKTAQKN